MLGRRELEALELQKQALVLESGLNREALSAHVHELHSAVSWIGEGALGSHFAAPALSVLAPLAGFILSRFSRRAGLLPGRLTKLLGWVLPAYQLWKTFMARRKHQDSAEEPPR